MPTIIEELRKLSNRTPAQRGDAAHRKAVQEATPDVLKCVKSVIKTLRYEAERGNRTINAQVWHLSRSVDYTPELFCILVSDRLTHKGFKNVYVRDSTDYSDVPVIWVSLSWA